MKTALLLLFLAVPGTDGVIDVSPQELGFIDRTLSTTPTSLPINMEGTRPTNQLDLQIVVTPGSSTVIVVTCYESPNQAKWGQIGWCDAATPTSNCQPDSRKFTLSAYTTDAAGKKTINSRWDIKTKWTKCSVDDPNDGTGTAVMSAERSWQ